MNISAPQQRFEGMTSEIRQKYPHPESITGERRCKLRELLRVYASDCARARCYLVEDDHVAPLEWKHRHTDFGRPKIWQLEMTNNFSQNHYLPTYQYLLQKMEETEPQITPGKTIMLEVTTGSAGIAFGHVGQLAGYPRELFAPQEIAKNDPARWALMKEAVEGNDACGGKLIAAEGNEFLASAIRQFRLRIQELGGQQGRKEGRFALPNHSLRAETVEACKQSLLEAMRNGDVPPLDAAIVGIGNGTSAEAMKQALKQHCVTKPVLFGFEGKHDPGLWQKLHGSLPAHEREDRVWMYGVDGTGNIDMDFRFVEALLHEGALKDILLISRQECEKMFETLNHGQTVEHTMGRSSAAGLAAAARVARENNFRNVCCIRYDTAAPYGSSVPISSNPIDGQTLYTSHGNWSNHTDAQDYGKDTVFR